MLTLHELYVVLTACMYMIWSASVTLIILQRLSMSVAFSSDIEYLSEMEYAIWVLIISHSDMEYTSGIDYLN